MSTFLAHKEKATMNDYDLMIDRDADKLLRLLAQFPKLQQRVRDFDGEYGFMLGFERTLPDDLRDTWDAICSSVDTIGHSGASWACVCRSAQNQLILLEQGA